MKQNSNTIKEEHCWNKIGVWRKGLDSCPKLTDLHHCNYCDKYTQFARLVFEKKLPVEYQKEWSSVCAQKKIGNNHSLLQLVIFRIGEEWYALESRFCSEISEIRTCHKIPHQKNPLIIGLVNVHGTVLLNLSFAYLLNTFGQMLAEESPGDSKYRYYLNIVYVNKSYIFGVKEIDGIVKISHDDLDKAPKNGQYSNTVIGVLRRHGEVISLLNADNLFEGLENKIRG